jgi:hypothetical protein
VLEITPLHIGGCFLTPAKLGDAPCRQTEIRSQSPSWPHVLPRCIIFDLMVPLGVAAGVPYVVVILLGAWLPGVHFVFGFALAGTA